MERPDFVPSVSISSDKDVPRFCRVQDRWMGLYSFLLSKHKTVGSYAAEIRPYSLIRDVLADFGDPQHSANTILKDSNPDDSDDDLYRDTEGLSASAFLMKVVYFLFICFRVQSSYCIYLTSSSYCVPKQLWKSFNFTGNDF